ncbi:MAG: hypothetical protein NC184_02570 [Roseburia sp.]|nr:hypothetical protein [Roseburia sp.]
MFLSLQKSIEITLIALVAVQYAIALFCLLKLAYFDVSKREYVLWNLLIMLVFFIGSGVFLVYYYMHPDKHIGKAPEKTGVDGQAPTEEEKPNGEETEPEANDASADIADGADKAEEKPDADIDKQSDAEADEKPDAAAEDEQADDEKAAE